MSKLNFIFEGLREKIVTQGYQYVGAELVSENGVKILRVYADSEKGLDVDDCEKIARESNDLLDLHEASLPERYFLEVSSPGVERPLFSIEDYREFTGKEVSLKLKGQKKLVGVISGISGDNVVCLTDKEGLAVSLPFSEIRKGNLVFERKVGEKKVFKKNQKKKNKKK